MAGTRVHVVMPAELVERIDAARGVGVSRGEFVRRAVEQALDSAGGKSAPSRTGREPPIANPSPAPAEQPLNRADMFRRATQR